MIGVVGRGNLVTPRHAAKPYPVVGRTPIVWLLRMISVEVVSATYRATDALATVNAILEEEVCCSLDSQCV